MLSTSKKNKFANLLLILGFLLLLHAVAPFILQEAWYKILQLRHKKYVLDTSETTQSSQSVFGKLLSSTDLTIDPVNRDFTIVVEKIGLNAPVVLGVSVTDQKKYNEALKGGVAHAIVSDLPSAEPGNVYLFAHASFNFWGFGKYATAFNLLRKLENNDEINIFYHDKRYVYQVVNKETLPGWNTYPLTRPVLEPILTLQTCDPPGTTLNRLIVTAKLKRVI